MTNLRGNFIPLTDLLLTGPALVTGEEGRESPVLCLDAYQVLDEEYLKALGIE